MELTETESNSTRNGGDQTSNGLDETADSERDQKQKASKSLQAIQFIEQNIIRSFSTPEGEVFARLKVDGRTRVVGVRSSTFKDWVAQGLYAKRQVMAGDKAIAEAVGVLVGKTAYGGAPKERVHRRVAEHGGSLYFFLADDHHTVIQVDQWGWRECIDPPVNFVKSRSMLPLPMPQRAGTAALFSKYLNLSESDRVLAMAWLTAALRPQGPYAVLNLNGEQGSGKSTTTRVLKRLIDPTETETRAAPRDEKGMMVAAHNEHVLAWDNLSKLQDWCSDTLCRIATGASIGSRALWTDGDEFIIKAQRPQILNGINEVATRPDLLERSLMLTALAIPEEDRRSEDEFWADFERDQPAMLGVLLDALSMALRNVNSVRLNVLPRMADFVKWGYAAAPAFGIDPQEFLRAYYGNQAEAQDSLLDSSALGQAVMTMLDAEGTFRGSPQEAYNALAVYAGATLFNGKPMFFQRPEGFPKDARGTTAELKRLGPVLGAAGVKYTPPAKSNGQRVMSLTRVTADRVDRAA